MPLEHLVSSAYRKMLECLTERGISLIKIKKRRGPRMLPCGTPERTGRARVRCSVIQ